MKNFLKKNRLNRLHAASVASFTIQECEPNYYNGNYVAESFYKKRVLITLIVGVVIGILI